jgi:DNA polymerase III subunit beta
MKFNVNRENLLTPLQHLVAVIEKRQTMPILSNVLMVISDDLLTLTGTDLEIQLVVRVIVSDVVPGSITVPARKLLDLCRLLPTNAEIVLEVTGDKVKLISNRGKFILSCLPAEQYPDFSESELDKQFCVTAKQLKKALEKTIFCMANQDVRYYLNGLLLNISNSKLKLVASDGHRLALFEDDLANTTGYEERVILPRKGAVEIYRLLTDSDEQLTVYFSTNNIKVVIDQVTFSAKLVDAKYPDFSKVFQQGFFEPIVIPKQQMKDVLTRVAVLSNEKFKGITLDFKRDSVIISTHNPEHDEAEEELAINYSGEPLSIAFNAQYLLDAISNITSDNVLLTISNNISSCFIDESNPVEYKFVVMPMRI